MARFSQLQMGVMMREKLLCVLTFFYVTVRDWLMIMSFPSRENSHRESEIRENWGSGVWL